MKKIILTAGTILWMAVIFSFSAKPADESADMSLSVGSVVGRTFVKEYSSWTKAEQKLFAQKIDYPVRKTAHAAEYAVLAMLLMGMLGSYNITGVKRSGICFAAAIIYAASDEFHQLFVPGRSCQLGDVLIDSMGALVGIVLYCLCGYLYRQKKES